MARKFFIIAAVMALAAGAGGCSKCGFLTAWSGEPQSCRADAPAR
jgi:hypothetical protein